MRLGRTRGRTPCAPTLHQDRLCVGAYGMRPDERKGAGGDTNPFLVYTL
jgi:hypothetical protein